MARKSVTMEIKVSLAWWFIWYVRGVAAMSKITGLDPNMDKMRTWVARAVKTEVVR